MSSTGNPITDDELETLIFEHGQRGRWLDSAHDMLHDLSAPRDNFTVSGRLDWLQFNCPVEWRALREAAERVRQEQADGSKPAVK